MLFVTTHWCCCVGRCSLYNNIKTPGQLQPSATFLLFKEGIEPIWEDPVNANGGCWTVSLNKGPNAKQQIDAWWLNSVGVRDHRQCVPARLRQPCADRAALRSSRSSGQSAARTGPL